ncbi:hypothetical protein AOLI_G00051090 [Acnodon oligacanthus]
MNCSDPKTTKASPADNNDRIAVHSCFRLLRGSISVLRVCYPSATVHRDWLARGISLRTVGKIEEVLPALSLKRET